MRRLQQLRPIAHSRKELRLVGATRRPRIEGQRVHCTTVCGVTTAAVDTAQRSFQSLAANHATAGGINDQFLKHLVEHGLLTAFPKPSTQFCTESARNQQGLTSGLPFDTIRTCLRVTGKSDVDHLGMPGTPITSGWPTSHPVIREQ